MFFPHKVYHVKNHKITSIFLTLTLKNPDYTNMSLTSLKSIFSEYVLEVSSMYITLI